MKHAVIVNAKRTIIGKKSGLLKGVPPHFLIEPVFRYLSTNLVEQINDIILGNVVGPGGNIARLSALQAGFPLSVPGVTIDRQCSAGLEAIRLACYLIQGGAGTVYLAGGTESCSTSSFPGRARFSPENIGDPDMGIAAENVAAEYKITRDMQDQYTEMSYARSWNAYESSLFTDEIVPISNHVIDEGFLKKRNIKQLLQRAKPVFQNQGTVTPVNSCGINDGASAVLVMEEQTAKEYGFQPVLQFVDSEVSGVSPLLPGIAPVSAIQSLLERHSLTMEDIDLIEINEAFASKVAACAKELNIPYEKLNVRGGALALGHPYGASGAILITRLFHEVKRRKNTKYVLAAIGSGGGIGLAVLFKAYN
ncbi:acetyl-CoA C-acyltransferase [Metabacillus arenae]|uniref:Acetyl-CoA C-acyltransferase n=1 Tax=Metabacillus arenae TaxID=2771434 RepID=A0A926S0Q0_9BACI|nr:acetyl-CoA C-acyltransferase [Metabacillus arenae]MBD1380239.1 acetyl-CoA C-acyltransferase [Metabacillus arenae]